MIWGYVIPGWDWVLILVGIPNLGEETDGSTPW